MKIRRDKCLKNVRFIVLCCFASAWTYIDLSYVCFIELCLFLFVLVQTFMRARWLIYHKCVFCCHSVQRLVTSHLDVYNKTYGYQYLKKSDP